MYCNDCHPNDECNCKNKVTLSKEEILLVNWNCDKGVMLSIKGTNIHVDAHSVPEAMQKLKEAIEAYEGKPVDDEGEHFTLIPLSKYSVNAKLRVKYKGIVIHIPDEFDE